MIPVSLPGGNFYVLMLVSLACLSTLFTWLAVLGTSRPAREWLGEHRRLGTGLMSFLALIGAIFPYLQFSQWNSAQKEAQADRDRSTTLTQPTTLSGVNLPAGTQLLLRKSGDLGSFEMATFPTPTPVLGLAAKRLYRYPAEVSARGGPRPETLSMAIERDQAMDGWLCGHGHRVEFALRDGKPQFASCHLPGGNVLNQQAVPAGAWLTVESPRPDAENAPKWRLRTDGSEPIVMSQMPLLKADIKLDASRRVLGFEGLLSKETQLGELTYPTGTRVATPSLRLSNAQPGDLLFTPARGRSAHRASGKDIESDQSVLQAADGTVRQIMSNREAGVLDVPSMRVGLPR